MASQPPGVALMNVIEHILTEHAAALARREAARNAFAEADADVIGLTNVIREEGGASLPGPQNLKLEWLRAAERAGAILFTGLLPEASPAQIMQARSRWKAMLAQLLKSAA